MAVMETATHDLAHLWEAYWESGEVEVRNQLVEYYLYLVPICVRSFLQSHGLPAGHYDRYDLSSAGKLGLIHAVEKFDPTYEVKFTTWASRTIVGYVRMALRDADWMSRRSRENASWYEATLPRIRAQLGHDPTIEDLAEYLGISARKARNLWRDATAKHIRMESVNVDLGEDGASLIWDEIPDRQARSPIETLIQQERESTLTYDVLLSCLTDLRERVIIRSHYEKGIKFVKIAEYYQVTRNIIARIHVRALKKIKSSVRKGRY